MIDMAAAYSVFANGGKRAVPFAAIEIRNSRGDSIYRRDTDGPAYEQVIPAKTIAEMNNILKEVVNGGTARAAQLNGVVAAGKTGTTNAYRDAWFDGFTGNYVCTVWFGNDDDTSMNNMTGGSLPARTWHEIMAYAHQGIELKNPYGVTEIPPISVSAAAKANEKGAQQRPATLSRRSSEAIMGVEAQLRAASEKLQAARSTPGRGAAVIGAGSGRIE